ncbi:MAG: hypothetical protein PHZ25_03520 [Candidatus Pacebacteria bacterium]|nr:hypothetical protein [Candidatus Paceibacterota bacterium]
MGWLSFFKGAKIFSFSTTSLGVGTSVGAMKLSPTTALAGSLTAIGTSSFYSVFKNFEVVQTIQANIKHCNAVLAKLQTILPEQQAINIRSLVDRLDLTREEITKAEKYLQGKSLRKLPITNSVLQALLFTFTAVSNAKAFSDQSSSGDISTWGALNIAAGFAVVGQALVHVVIASKLRHTANVIDKVNQCLIPYERILEIERTLTKIESNRVELGKLDRKCGDMRSSYDALQIFMQAIHKNDQTLIATEFEKIKQLLDQAKLTDGNEILLQKALKQQSEIAELLSSNQAQTNAIQANNINLSQQIQNESQLMQKCANRILQVFPNISSSITQPSVASNSSQSRILPALPLLPSAIETTTVTPNTM